MSKWAVGIVFLALGLVVYLPSLTGPFQYDDQRVVLDAKVRENSQAWGYGGVWGTRGLSQGSFWLDYRVWGENTVPYHVENVVIHVVTAWLVVMLLQQLGMKRELAIFGGLVFLLHPLQTQAVAYISQRFESMAAMWYLLAVVLYLKARLKPMPGGGWYVGAWLAGLAAVSSKETAITLPVVLGILEWVVIKRKLYWRNYLILGAFLALAIKIPVQILMSANWGGKTPTVAQMVDQAKAVELQKLEMTWWTYLLTQFNVLRTYLRLGLVPVNQSLDYDYPLTTNWNIATTASLGLLLVILALSVWWWKRGEWLPAVGVWWWFINLAITSSIIPIRDVIYEHRVYLSMAGWVMVMVWLMQKLIDRYGKSIVLGGVVGLLVVYGILSFARSQVWASEVSLWEDAWKKGPNKDRTNKNYGFVLTEVGRLREGIVRLERAVELNPNDQDYRITLGAAYLQAQEWEQAKAQFAKATVLKPDKADGWNNLGVAEFQLKHYAESKMAFEMALKKEPEFYMAWLGLGGAEIVLQNLTAAEVALKKAMEIEPAGLEAQRNWAILQRLKQEK